MGVKFVRKFLRAVFRYDPGFCDMYENDGSRSAAEEYLGHIRPSLHQQFGDQRLTILDAGCQAGRFLIPLAEEGHRLIGIDTSGFALRRARRHAQAKGLSVRLHRDTIASLRRWVQPETIDVVLCLEVLYLCQDYQRLLALLGESLKPGGITCISHRPLWYYIASAVRRGQPEQALSLLGRIEGPSPEGNYHNWQTPQQLEALYHEAGLQVLQWHPVNRFVLDLDGQRVHAPLTHALEPLRQGTSTFHVPSYLLVIAQKIGALQ